MWLENNNINDIIILQDIGLNMYYFIFIIAFTWILFFLTDEKNQNLNKFTGDRTRCTSPTLLQIYLTSKFMLYVLGNIDKHETDLFCS